MAISNRIQTLEEKHGELEAQLQALSTSPSASDTEIANVKRQKLQLKDEIERLRQMAA